MFGSILAGMFTGMLTGMFTGTFRKCLSVGLAARLVTTRIGLPAAGLRLRPAGGPTLMMSVRIAVKFSSRSLA